MLQRMSSSLRARAALLGAVALGGIGLGASGAVGVPTAAAIALIGGAMAVPLALSHLRSQALVACLVGVVAAAAVGWGAAAREQAMAIVRSIPMGERVVVEGTVDSLPEKTDRSVRFTVRVHSISDNTIASRARIRVVALPWAASIQPGDRLTLRGAITLPSLFRSERTGMVVDTRERLLADRVVGVMRFPRFVAHMPAEFFTLLRWNSMLRERFVRYLPQPLAALAAGMLLGGRDALGSALEEVFVRSGLIHLVVLSGQNIALVLGFLMLLLRPLPRVLALSLALISLVVIVLFAGAEAPALRAGIMGGVAILALIVGRRADALAALILAAIAIAVVNPLAWVSNLSLHLSLAATAGVLLLGTPIAQWIEGLLPAPLAAGVGATVGAQIAVSPLLWYLAGSLSVVALPANLLVVPVVPLILLLGSGMLLAGFVSDTLASLLSVPLAFLLQWVVEVGEWFARQDWSTITLPPITWGGVLLLYGMGMLVFYAVRHWLARRAMVSQLRAAQ